MIIKLNVSQKGSCSRLYVYAEDYEEGYLLSPHEEKIRAVRIWHNKSISSMSMAKPLDNCYNDYTVTFKSNVPFKDFCEKFSHSEFNDKSKYSLYTHNCAHGANFALKLANIDLNVSDGIRLTRIFSPEYNIKLPLKAFGPSDLYCLARDYKIKILQKQPINFKTELAVHALKFWAKKTNDAEIKKQTDIIESDAKRQIDNNMHHSEIYLKALIDTIDIVINLGKRIESENYKNAASFFKTRATARSRQLLYQTLITHLFCYSTLIALRLTTGSTEVTIENGIKLGILAGLIITPIITNLRFIKAAYEQEPYNYTPSSKTDTPLSQAMLTLVDHLDGTYQDTKKNNL